MRLEISFGPEQTNLRIDFIMRAFLAQFPARLIILRKLRKMIAFSRILPCIARTSQDYLKDQKAL